MKIITMVPSHHLVDWARDEVEGDLPESGGDEIAESWDGK